MATMQECLAGAMRRPIARAVTHAVIGLGLCAVTAASAVVVKEFRAGVHPLAAVDLVSIDPTPENSATNSDAVRGAQPSTGAILASNDSNTAEPDADAPTQTDEPAAPPEVAAEPAPANIDPSLLRYAADPTIRWFNGRPMRPARTMTMTVTAYSPDEKSCGPDANGHTATLHSVNTNNMKLVAADTRVLPFGSVVSIPGYNDGKVVPVLDRGGAIKGRHLDALFPTDAQATAWGKKKLQVTVWEYADGKPADNPRKLR